MRPLLFLDIDDVLVINSSAEIRRAITTYRCGDADARPEIWANLILTEARDNLAILHNEFFPLYVISSTWSNHLTQEHLREIFKRTDLAFVADNLHEQWTTIKAGELNRVDEIENWIAQHRQPGQPLIVLDDLESGWSLHGSALYRRGYAVLCDAWTGFIADKLLEAQKKLRAQLLKIS